MEPPVAELPGSSPRCDHCEAEEPRSYALAAVPRPAGRPDARVCRFCYLRLTGRIPGSRLDR